MPKPSPKFCTLLLLLLAPLALAQEPTQADRRATEIRHLDLTYTFAGYPTKEAWLQRAAYLKQQILLSAGLWPAPPKTPLNAVIFGKVERGDHTLEKVYFESYPGHYVSGNLYRPKNSTGKLPAVLCPHGHWTYGRLENQPLNSGAARAATFARQGYVAFTWDMVGYVDSTAISHRFASGHREGTSREVLWGVNLLGLQLWNSMRAVDFLLSLPEVDAERIGCTGESGGGTQTFLLTAVDERIKVAAPVNMVSFLMQGGSLCENAPNLRIDTNNVEIAALTAPRPMLLVAATGDWTKNMLTSEYPAIRNIYRLFNAENKVAAVQMDAPHNYNQASREAVYGWFAHWLQGRAEKTPIKERGGAVASLAEMLVFFSRPRPANELNEEQLTEALIAARQKQVAEARPRSEADLANFRTQFGAALKYALLAEYPPPAEVRANKLSAATIENGATKTNLLLSRKGAGEAIAAQVWLQVKPKKGSAFVLVIDPVAEGAAEAAKLAQQIVQAGHSAMLLRCFAGGRQVPENIKFFTTYNRTDAANRVQDILTALAYLAGVRGQTPLYVIAPGQAGLWALLARGLAPQIERMVVDAMEFDNTSDAAFLQALPIPGLRRAGDFYTSAANAPLTPLLIHNTGGKFQTDELAALYRQSGRAAAFQTQVAPLSTTALLAWLTAK